MPTGRNAAILMLFAAAVAEAAPVATGPMERVYRWETERCARWDIPDAPARAWRGADGVVRLIAGSDETRAAVGPSLDAMTRDCAVLHRGGQADDPAAWDDRLWIAAVRPAGGGRVEALAHAEFHGDLRPELCAAGTRRACWANAVVALNSDDGGRSFERAGVVAAPPYPYHGRLGRRVGYFNPSNIVERDGFLYVFVFAEAWGAQRRGACLLRRSTGGGAADWRAWDGRSFATRLAGPGPDGAPGGVCAPLPGIASTVTSVARLVPGGPWLAVTPAAARRPDGTEAVGIWWMVSDDLLDWSAPELVLEVPLLWRRDCAAPAVYAYPSLIDEGASATFDALDGGFWLYLTEAQLDAACRVGPRRDLVRLPLSWRP